MVEGIVADGPWWISFGNGVFRSLVNDVGATHGAAWAIFGDVVCRFAHTSAFSEPRIPSRSHTWLAVVNAPIVAIVTVQAAFNFVPDRRTSSAQRQFLAARYERVAINGLSTVRIAFRGAGESAAKC